MPRQRGHQNQFGPIALLRFLDEAPFHDSAAPPTIGEIRDEGALLRPELVEGYGEKVAAAR
jgi:hypothetical protein